MRCTYLILFAVLFGTMNAQAINNEATLRTLAETFPLITKINSDKRTSYASNGQSSFTPSGVIYPEHEGDLLEVISYFNRLKKNDPTIRPLVISAGSRPIDDHVSSGWSFDAHAQGEHNDIVLNTSKLAGLYGPIDWRNDFDRKKGVLKLWVYAGTTWRDLTNLVNEAYLSYSGDTHNYFVPIISPTGGQISLGGSFASNTHARGTSVKGGYFADTVDAFKLATIIDGQPVLKTIDKALNPDLFHALIGSFGRGGIVSALKITMQLIASDKVATTRARKVKSIEEMTQAFAADRERLRTTSVQATNDKWGFRATVGIISDDFDTFYMLENDLEQPQSDMPPFPLYGAPDCKALLIYKVARALPQLANCLASTFLDWHCAKSPCEFFSGKVSGVGEFHNQPLNNYIFFQDTFSLNIMNSEPKDHQTAHFTLMMKLENLPLAVQEIKRIKRLPEFHDITFELQDLLPLPSTQVLMAPAYAANPDDQLYIAYTLSWSVDERTRVVSTRLQAKIESELYALRIDGQPLAWLHPLKEFSFKKGRLDFYAGAAQKLESLLQAHGIEDRGLFYSKVHHYLYGPDF